MEIRAAGIVGTGLYLPKEIRTNEWFKQFELLPFDELFDNTGVMERRVCAKGEKSSDMETKALLEAVKNAGINIEDVELILDGPNLHDQPQPGNAALVQYKSGAKKCRRNKCRERMYILAFTDHHRMGINKKRHV